MYGQFTWPSTADVTTAKIGFAGATTVPNQTYAGLPNPIKVSANGVGAVVAVVIPNSTTFNIWGNGAIANVANNSLTTAVVTVTLSYPAS